MKRPLNLAELNRIATLLKVSVSTAKPGDTVDIQEYAIVLLEHLKNSSYPEPFASNLKIMLEKTIKPNLPSEPGEPDFMDELRNI